MAIPGCNPQSTDNKVVLYCSVDEVFARPIIASLEKETGLDIQPLFDVEAAKTAGLANKLRAERNRPRADVFWSSAVLQMQMLGDEGLLASHVSSSAEDIPARFKDPLGRWAGIGLRARVMISTRANESHPLSFVPQGSFAISNPQFGTASDWSAAYGARWGKEKTLRYFQQLKKAGVRILPGNADVASAVAGGHLTYGITDSDDFLNQVREKKPVHLVRTTADNVLVPGAAALIQGAPHEANARKLLDALLGAKAERQLIESMPGVFSVRRTSDPDNWRSGGVDFGFLAQTPEEDMTKWVGAWKEIRTPLSDLLTP